MPLSVKKIALSIICPDYTPRMMQRCVDRHNYLLEQLYSKLVNEGFICVREARISGLLHGYKINGVVDLLCYNPKNYTIHIYEVKAARRSHPSYFLQAILYAIILAKMARTNSLAEKIVIHVVCENREVVFKLADCPIEYLVMLMESFYRLMNDVRVVGPWCRYCRNRSSCF